MVKDRMGDVVPYFKTGVMLVQIRIMPSCYY